MSLIWCACALFAGLAVARGVELALNYWSPRISIATLYLQWSDDR